MLESISAFPIVDIEMPTWKKDGEGEFEWETVQRRVTVTVILTAGTDYDSAVFTAGEAITAPVDNFCRKRGKSIALSRAESAADGYSTQFTLDEVADHDNLPQLTFSEIPLPFGLLNRLKMLIPREGEDSS